MIWVLALIGVYVAFCFYLAGMYRRPARIAETMLPEFREILVDGSPVWTIGPDNPKASFVMCHGYGGSRHTWVTLAEKLAERGYKCYIPSMPAHGNSPHQFVGFGGTESDLALAVARTAREDAVPVVGIGVSLGGAAVLLACEKDPKAFDAICIESAFTTLPEATNAFLDRALPAGRFAFAPVRFIAEWQSGIKASSIQPIRGATAFKGRPSLILHGDRDRLFPMSFSDQLAQAAGVEVWRVPNAAHAYCYDVAPGEYEKRLVALAATVR